jgi:hypothetical protein
MREIRLSSEERRFLLDRCPLAQEWIDLLGDVQTGARSYALSKPQIDALSEQVVTCIQTLGFDEDWEPNDAGKLLEGILDKLAPKRTG